MAYREERVTGVVARLVTDKGFGFIKPDAGGDECFFHRTATTEWDALTPGARVEFVQGRGPKGPRAEGVRLA